MWEKAVVVVDLDQLQLQVRRDDTRSVGRAASGFSSNICGRKTLLSENKTALTIVVFGSTRIEEPSAA